MDKEHTRRTKERNKLSPPQPTILEQVGTVYGHLSPATSRTRYPPLAEDVRGRSDHGVTRPRARLRTRPYGGGMAQEKEKVDKGRRGVHDAQVIQHTRASVGHQDYAWQPRLCPASAHDPAHGIREEKDMEIPVIRKHCPIWELEIVGGARTYLAELGDRFAAAQKHV